MKRRVWTVLPVYLLFVGMMVAMSVITYNYNRIIAIVEIGVSIAAFALVLVMTLNFRRYIHSLSVYAASAVYDLTPDFLESVKTPCAVCGKNGEIILFNSRFRKAFFGKGDPTNERIFPLIGGHELGYALSADQLDVEYGDKKYTVLGREVRQGALFAFIDNTYYKNIAQQYALTQKSVALLMFDNMEDFAEDSDPEAASARLSAENMLYRWAGKHSSLIRKLSDGRYIAIFDEKELQEQVEKRFRILDRVRSLSFNGRPITLSVGVGRGFDTLTESATGAKKALDMALGRGGDQIAILANGEYAFFGGVAKSVEKTSKVRTRVISESIRSAIEAADRVLVMGHRFSDLDCIGAAAGLYAVVTKKFRKPCCIVTDVERSMARQMIERLKKKDDEVFISAERALALSGPKTLLFIVDTHSPDFIESAHVYKNAGNVIVIDHHRKMVNYIDNASVFFHEPSASSASELVTEIVGYLGDDCLDRDEAEALLSGIMLDTKNFIINTGVRTFEAAAYLRKKGADTVSVRDVFANSLENYKNKSRLVAEAQIVNHCAIAVARDVLKNSRLVCAQAADDLLAIQDTYASFVISAIDLASVNISARSFGKINVQIIMEKLGGGGHQTMASAQLTGVSLDEAKDALIKVLKETLKP